MKNKRLTRSRWDTTWQSTDTKFKYVQNLSERGNIIRIKRNVPVPEGYRLIKIYPGTWIMHRSDYEVSRDLVACLGKYSDEAYSI